MMKTRIVDGKRQTLTFTNIEETGELAAITWTDDEHRIKEVLWAKSTAGAAMPESGNPWRDAVINELIVAHIYRAEHDSNPRKAIHDAITWNCQVALDPAVSSSARALLEQGRMQAQGRKQ